MNRVYKVIWSKAKHCYVVTSEIARSVTKSASSARSAGRKGAAVLAMAALLFTAGGVLGEAANVTKIAVNETGNVITATKEDLSTDVITINNVASAVKATQDGDGKEISTTYAKIADVVNVVTTVGELGGKYTALDGNVQDEAAAREAGDKTLNDRITAVKNFVLNETGIYYVSKNDAVVQDAGVVKADKKIGENVTALGKGLYDETAARIGADAAQDKVIQQVNDSLVQSVNTINKSVADGFTALNTADANEAKARTDADAAEKAARIGADAKLVEAVNSGITLSDDNVLQKNTTTVNADGNVTTKKADVTEMILNKGKDNQITLSEDGIKVGKNSTTMDEKGFYAGSDYDYGNAKAALDATEGKIRGADGNFQVNADGKVTAKGGVDTDGREILTRNGNINAGFGDISGKNISASGDLHADGDISGKAISGTSLNTQNGEINGGDIKSSGTIHAKGKITGNGLDAGSGAVEGNSLTLKGGDLDAGSGTITTKGNIKADGTITTKNLEVTDGFKTDHMTLGSEPLNYTKIDMGNVTSKVNENVSGVEYIAESIFNKDGSSITARIDEGATGKSIVGAKEISQYLGNKAEPKSSDKNVTRNMVRNGDNFSMEDTAVDGDKSSTVSQNAEERKVTVTDGTKTLTVTKNLTGGIVSETDDGAGNKVTLTQGMDGTYKVVTSGTSTEVISGQKIENYNGGLATTVTGNETHHVTKNQTITVDGTLEETVKENVTEDYQKDLSTTVGGNQTTTVTGDSSLSAKNIHNTANEALTNDANTITNTASDYVTTQIGDGLAVNSVMDVNGIANTAKGKDITNDAATIINTGTTSVTNQVQSAYGDTISTTWDDKGIKNDAKNKTVETTARDIQNTAIGGDITNTASNGTITNDANFITNTGKVSVTNQVDDNKVLVDKNQVQSVFGDTIYTTWDAYGIKNDAADKNVETTANDIKNTATGDITNTASTGTITNDAKIVMTKTGNNTVTSDNGGTTFENTAHSTAFKGGTVTKTTISGNTITTGEAVMDYANVTKDLSVGRNLNVEGNIETHDAVLSADSRQVVTGRQLYQTNERVDRLDNRIKKVGANAAALAALRPGDFNPDDKFSIAAGFGSYRNANAAALGLFYRPNENVLLSLGTSFGDGENMVNAGVSVKFGRGKSMAERRKEMADEVSSMRDEMRSQDERIAELEEMLKKQSELIEKLSKES